MVKDRHTIRHSMRLRSTHTPPPPPPKTHTHIISHFKLVAFFCFLITHNENLFLFFLFCRLYTQKSKIHSKKDSRQVSEQAFESLCLEKCEQSTNLVCWSAVFLPFLFHTTTTTEPTTEADPLQVSKKVK